MKQYFNLFQDQILSLAIAALDPEVQEIYKAIRDFEKIPIKRGINASRYSLISDIEPKEETLKAIGEQLGIEINMKDTFIEVALRLNRKKTISQRVEELRDLKNGWLDGHGRCLPLNALNGLTWLEQNFPNNIPIPYLYPTEDCKIRAEWSIYDFEISLDIDLFECIGSWHSWDKKSDFATSKELDFNNDGWKQLTELMTFK